MFAHVVMMSCRRTGRVESKRILTLFFLVANNRVLVFPEGKAEMMASIVLGHKVQEADISGVKCGLE